MCWQVTGLVLGGEGVGFYQGDCEWVGVRKRLYFSSLLQVMLAEWLVFFFVLVDTEIFKYAMVSLHDFVQLSFVTTNATVKFLWMMSDLLFCVHYSYLLAVCFAYLYWIPILVYFVSSQFVLALLLCLCSRYLRRTVFCITKW